MKASIFDLDLKELTDVITESGEPADLEYKSGRCSINNQPETLRDFQVCLKI